MPRRPLPCPTAASLREEEPYLLLWVDVETTGLNPWEGESLLEVAALVTDLEGEEVGEEFTAVVCHEDPQALREQATPLVREMHDATGLWGRLPEGLPLEEVDARLLRYVQAVAPQERSIRLAGSSCRLDMNFLEAYLPRTYAHLHYRTVDVSSLAYVLADAWGMVPGSFQKRKVHAALEDIRESLQEYRWLRGRVEEHRRRGPEGFSASAKAPAKEASCGPRPGRLLRRR